MYETFYKSFPFSPLPKTNPRKRKVVFHSLGMEKKEKEPLVSFSFFSCQSFWKALLPFPPLFPLGRFFRERKALLTRKFGQADRIRGLERFFRFPAFLFFLLQHQKCTDEKSIHSLTYKPLKSFFCIVLLLPLNVQKFHRICFPHIILKRSSLPSRTKKSAARIRKLYSTAKKERRGGVNK